VYRESGFSQSNITVGVSFIFNNVYVYILLVLLKGSVQLLTLCS